MTFYLNNEEKHFTNKFSYKTFKSKTISFTLNPLYEIRLELYEFILLEIYCIQYKSHLKSAANIPVIQLFLSIMVT